MTGQDRTRQDRTGQDRTGQDRTGQDRTGQDSVLWVVVHIQADLAFEVLSGMVPQHLAKNVHLVSSTTPDTPPLLRDELHVSLCVNARRCVAICGEVWRSVTKCDEVWRCVAMCGNVWRCEETCVCLQCCSCAGAAHQRRAHQI
jgi:hypothetical protein